MENKVYSTEALHAMAGGNQAFIKQMCVIFLQVVPEGMDKIEEGWAARDVKKIFQYAHKIKSNINHLSVVSAKEPLMQIEKMTREGILDEAVLPPLIQESRRIINQAVEQLKADFEL